MSDHCVEQADCVVQATGEKMAGTWAGGGHRRKAGLPPAVTRLVQLQNLPMSAVTLCLLERGVCLWTELRHPPHPPTCQHLK